MRCAVDDDAKAPAFMSCTPLRGESAPKHVRVQ